MPYYAVRHGGTPGIYHTWDECKEQVTGYSGARYKKFPTVNEARDFIEAKDSYSGGGGGGGSGRGGSRGGSYAAASSYSGRSSCSSDGIKKYSVDQHVPPAKVTSVGKRRHNYGSQEDKLYGYHADPERQHDSDDDYTPVQKVSISVSRGQPTAKPSTAAKPAAAASRPIVFVDGSCSNNGNYRGKARAGLGVHWPSGLAPDLREPLSGEKQSNQRAEMMAACRAMEQALGLGLPSIEMCSDSMYTIKGVNEWMPNWKKRGWVTTAGKPVENRDLWEKLDGLKQRVDVKWTHVRGHKGIVGNERADVLARQGMSQQ